MESEVGRGLGVDQLEKPQELAMAMPWHAGADHLAVEHAQCREQVGRAIAFVVMGDGAGTSLLDRQPRLGAVERLDLALLVARKNQRLVRWVEVKARGILDLLNEVRVAGDLEGSRQMRLQLVRVPDPLDAGVGGARCHRRGANTTVLSI